MNKGKLLLNSTAIIWSSTLVLTLNAHADSTYFKDKVASETPATPVEAKAAEFKKVLQEIEVEKKPVEAAAPATPTPIEATHQSTEAAPTEEAATIFTYEEKETKAPEQTAVIQPEQTAQDATAAEPQHHDTAIFATELETQKQPVQEQQVTQHETIQAPEVAPAPKPELTASAEPTPQTEITQSEEAPIIIASAPQVEVQELIDIQKGRPALGILETNRDLHTQKWYLFSSAKRGLKNQTSHVEIVSIVGADPKAHRGEDVKALLVEMGIKPENIKVHTAKGEESQVGRIYIFGS